MYTWIHKCNTHILFYIVIEIHEYYSYIHVNCFRIDSIWLNNYYTHISFKIVSGYINTVYINCFEF